MADQNQNITVELIFLKEEDMPKADIAHLTVVRAITLVVSLQGVDGAQTLWRIYMKTLKYRLDLLAMKTVRILAKRVPMYDQNPYKTNQGSPEDRKTRSLSNGYLSR